MLPENSKVLPYLISGISLEVVDRITAEQISRYPKVYVFKLAG